MKNVKLTLIEAQVLKALADHHNAHDGLSAQLEDFNYLHLGRGTLICTLHKLIDHGLVDTARKRYNNPPARINEYFMVKKEISFTVEGTVSV